MSPAALNLWVFRDGRRHVSGQRLKNSLLDCLALLHGRCPQEDILCALLRAGDLESAMADAGLCTASLEKLTDSLAAALVGLRPPEQALNYREILESCELPEDLTTSVAEGFAYYVLHPLAYADVLEDRPRVGPNLVIIGIRSIGATLSAVTAAAARKRGRQAVRMTVRPQGHPYNRKTTFTPQEKEVIRGGLASGADFLIVDEGPGLSGSSFLSVAEALLGEGVAAESVTVICSHQPDFDSFRADHGPQRARRFRWVAVHSIPRRPDDAQVYVGGGEWRRWHFADEASWPASWVNLERSKYVSPTPTRKRLFKFIGLGHYGDEVLEREWKLATHGFSPMPQKDAHGFAAYPWLSSRPMRSDDLTEVVLLRLAEYCGFRAHAFAAEVGDLKPLQQMANFNLAQMDLPLPIALHLERPVIADGRMQPHEWLLAPDGRILKTDGGSHGDDHFFPGPTDIAWDLAGSIVEWRMDAEQADFFLERYRRITGDDARLRVKDFVIAYSTFRKAYLLMAANALQGSDEQSRLERAAASYGLALKADVQATAV
jgi:hypothetical protein